MATSKKSEALADAESRIEHGKPIEPPADTQGPVDVTDASVRLSSVHPDATTPEAQAVGTTAGAVPTGEAPSAAAGSTTTGKGRVETYKATRPDGTEVTVTHNIDTGETSVK